VDLHLALGKNQTTIITNWADADVITPAPRSANRLLKSTGLQKKFVIQYSGNMGRTHGLEVILDAAHRLREERVFHFFLIGSGAKFRGVEAAVSRSQSGNVTLLPWQPREELADTLNACDVAIVSFIRGISGISVPSRMYNVMAAGKPLIAVADEDSEVAMVVREECIGWVVPPDDTEALVRAIKEAHSKKALLKQMGVRARQASLGYSLENVLLSYRRLFASLETGAAKSTGEREVQSRHV
jgi:colanic acid biosynthesis glycosyl transferase WcaI